MFAIKRELKLNNKEKTLLAKHAGYSRWVYNFGLNLMKQLDRKLYKGSSSKKISTIKKVLTNYTKKQPENSWTNELSSRVYQNALRDLTDSYKRYFSGQNEEPVFKNRKDKQSFTVDNCAGKSILEFGKKIKVPTIGTLKLKEALDCKYVTQTFTISKTADRWFISFVVDAERIPNVQKVIEPVGIDLGVKCFATLSDGSIYIAPKPFKKAKTKLALMQYRNRNKISGNRKKKIRQFNNATKHYKNLAVQHFRIANKRSDFLNKTTTEIVVKFKEIHIEDLNIAGMIANRKLSKAISDLGFYEFRRQLEYKSKFYGSKLLIVDRWFPSSKTCSNCSCKKETLSLSERVFNCNNCGFNLDRDLNAAINLSKYN